MTQIVIVARRTPLPASRRWSSSPNPYARNRPWLHDGTRWRRPEKFALNNRPPAGATVAVTYRGYTDTGTAVGDINGELATCDSRRPGLLIWTIHNVTSTDVTAN